MKTCQKCDGDGVISARLKNLATLDYDWHIIGCDMCNSKGFTNEEDKDRYNRSMGTGKYRSLAFDNFRVKQFW